MTKQEQQERYSRYVRQVTPVHNTWLDMFRAFWTGGAVCAAGQLLTDCLMKSGIEKDSAAIWTLIVLVAAAVILTAFHWFGAMTRYAGAGLLVPITGFANSVAAPAVESAPEGEVFGKGVQIFSIAGPVILYGTFSSWILGLIYWGLKFTAGIF